MGRTCLNGLICLILVVAYSGCDSNGGDNPNANPGQASVTVTGSQSATFSSSAASGGTSTGWGMGLGSGQQLVTFVTNQARPGTGSHTIGNLGGATISATLQLSGTAYLSTSGTLTVSSSSATRVEGTFSFDATEVLSSNTVTVTGSFDSPNAVVSDN